MRRCCLNRVESLLAELSGVLELSDCCVPGFPDKGCRRLQTAGALEPENCGRRSKPTSTGTGLVPPQTTRALGVHAAAVGRPKLQQEVRDRRRNIPMKTPMDSKLNRQSSPHRQRHEMPRVSNLLEPVVALEVREGVPALAGEVVFAVDQLRESLFGADLHGLRDERIGGPLSEVPFLADDVHRLGEIVHVDHLDEADQLLPQEGPDVFRPFLVGAMRIPSELRTTCRSAKEACPGESASHRRAP